MRTILYHANAEGKNSDAFEPDKGNEKEKEKKDSHSLVMLENPLRHSTGT